MPTATKARQPKEVGQEPLDELYYEIKRIAGDERDPRLKAWFRRLMLSAKRGLANKQQRSELMNAATASSDFQALMALLPPAAIAEIVERDDPLAEAERRGIEEMDKLLKEKGGTITVSALAKHKRVSLQAIHQARKRGQLIAVDAGQKEMLIPIWQFGSNWRLLDGVSEVLAELNRKNFEPLDVMIFFLTPSSFLAGQTPIAELAKGKKDRVQRLAVLSDEHGAL